MNKTLFILFVSFFIFQFVFLSSEIMFVLLDGSLKEIFIESFGGRIIVLGIGIYLYWVFYQLSLATEKEERKKIKEKSQSGFSLFLIIIIYLFQLFFNKNIPELIKPIYFYSTYVGSLLLIFLTLLFEDRYNKMITYIRRTVFIVLLFILFICFCLYVLSSLV